MIARLRYPKGYQFFDANGSPLALGELYYYAAGTTAPQDTYSDSAGTIANTNPVALDASGRLQVDVYLGAASDYKEVLTLAGAAVAPWPDDNIPRAAQPDWNAASGPGQILNKPALAAVATSGKYTDLSNTPAPVAVFTGDSGSGGTSGLVPAPAAGDGGAAKFLKADCTWAVPSGGGGGGGSYTLPPASASVLGGVKTGANISAASDGTISVTLLDAVTRVGIGTTDTNNALSVKGATSLFSNDADVRIAMSKGAAANTAAFNFQDNYSTRVQFGLLGNDSFTIATSADGSTFKNGLVIDPSTTLVSTGPLKLPAYTVAGLPSASTVGAGTMAWVTDSTLAFNSTNLGTTVAGGGTHGTRVTSDGTNWVVG